MRYCGLIILILLASCKTTQPVATATYSEDLSIHRPAMEVPVSIDTIPTETVTFVPLEGHIKQELDSIVRISIAQNREGKVVNGFVIQVYTGNSRDQANTIRRQMEDYFPELEPKISYHQPNFKVKAGRFTDRLRAHRIFEQVKEEFPRALLIPERFTMIYE